MGENCLVGTNHYAIYKLIWQFPIAATLIRTSMRSPAVTVAVVLDSVNGRRAVLLLKFVAGIVTLAAFPFKCTVAVAEAKVDEYPAAATRIPEYGVTNPLESTFNVDPSVAVANSADGKLYCNTLPAAVQFPPKLTENPPGVAHDGTDPVVLNC